jgi:amino acid adenylation domain-containing protein
MQLALPPGFSVSQIDIWFDQQLFPGLPIYNTGQALTIRGPLREDLFDIALRESIAESPGLRLPPRSDTQVFDIPVLDFRDEPDPIAAAQQWIRVEMGIAIPLEDTALFRFALIRVAEDHRIWFQKFHHIIIDATGRRLLSERTAARYRTLRFGSPLPSHQSAKPDELIGIERCYATSNSHAADRAYWLERFVNLPEPILAPDRRNSERGRTGCSSRIALKLGRSDFVRLEAKARTLKSSVFRCIVALSYVAFARLYERYDITLGLELANRSDVVATQFIGNLARPLPLLLTLNYNSTIADVVRQVDEARVQNYAHRHFPIHELVAALDITRQGRYGLFDIIINYLPFAYEFAFEKVPIEVANLAHGFTTPWLVTISDNGPTRDLDVTVDSDSGLISHEFAARLASSLKVLLLRGLDDLNCPLSRLPIMSEKTQAQLTGFAAGESVALPEETIATLCAVQAERTPDAIALKCGHQQLTYATLNSHAAQVARRLSACGVRPGVIVGIALPRTPNLVITVLAVHKAGGAYLALDPSYPAERTRYIIADAGAQIIVTNNALRPIFADSGAQVLLDSELMVSAAETETIETVPARPSDLAYVLYTSGSTGRPKAVGIEHRNLVNLIYWGRSIVSDPELRGVLFSTSLNFDLSTFEMFLPLAFGGCVIMVENLLALPNAPLRDDVRLINTGPSLLDALLRTSKVSSGVTTIILAGEKLSRHLASAIFSAAPEVRLLNCYGPTETTVYSTFSVVDKAASEPSIGRALWNTTLHVLGAGCALLPPGAEGELFIGGIGVGRGYLNRPELTAERFLRNPYGPGRIYRTGDRVRWRRDGELEFLGRVDHQVKLNGVRVEPGEIETAILAVPGISAAVVTLFEDSSGPRRLIAYLIPSPGTASDEDALRAALERQLPRYMVPSHFVWLEAMPMTPNGKLDRKALPAPPSNETQPANRLQEAKLERELIEIWEDVLQASPIGVHSEFFELGGDSLALLNLFATIEAQFGRRLSLDALTGGLTVAGLAQVLAGGGMPSATNDPVVPIQRFGHLPPFFCVHGVGGDVIHLQRLATHMGTNRPFFGLRRTPEMGLTNTIEQIAARYVAALLRHQPYGPFYLGGHSFGATVAYEMAQQLMKQDHEIGLLAIIDQRRPGFQLTFRNVVPALHLIIGNMPSRIYDELVSLDGGHWFYKLLRLSRRWLKAAMGLRQDASAMFDLKRIKPEQALIFKAHLRALQNYEPSLTPVPIALFRASRPLMGHLAMDETLGWRDLARGDVQIQILPGDHRSITTEPLVRQLAKALSASLDAAENAK